MEVERKETVREREREREREKCVEQAQDLVQ
jgi:hypothetical protein